MSDREEMRSTRFSSRLKRYSLDNDNVLPREVNQVRPKRSDARRATAPVPDTKRNANGKSNFDNNIIRNIKVIQMIKITELEKNRDIDN